MNLFELFVKIGVDDQASGKLSKLSSSLGKGLATAAKIGTAAVGAAAAGITALTKAAVNNYAEYEQLVGGVETLFKGSADKVQEYAANAYKTAGMSANEYMSTVTSFSASLLQSLGGDTDKAAEYANQALTDMSDNANKMGTSMEMIQNAYQGFAKQNYTMLDNLKLGYGGTKTEMERLIADAAKLDSSIKANDLSFGNIVKAINAVQTEMGITGTTALEAGRTISGSVGAMKSAWANLVTGFADGNADIEGLINNLVTTIVGDGTENNLGVIGNVLPAVETALGGIAKLIEGAAPKIIEILPGLVDRVVPSVISAAIGMVDAVVKVVPDLLDTVVSAIIENAPALIVAAVALIEQLSKSVLNMMPDILQLGIDLIFVLLDGITKMIDDPTFIQTIVDVVLKMVDILTNPDTITKLLNAAATIIVALAKGLIQALPQLLAKVPEIIGNLAKALGDFASPIFDAAKTWGKDLMDNFVSGIKAKIQKLKDMVSNVAQTVKDFLGFSEPEKGPLSNFHTYAPDMMDLFAKGIRDNEDVITDQIEKSFDFGERTMKFGAEYGGGYGVSKVAGGSFGGTSFGDVYINIDGANYSDPQILAVAVAQELQNMTDRRLAVYA